MSPSTLGLTRPSVMRRFLAACICFACAATADAEEISHSRPNVLFLIGDDHATHVFGAYGNPQARTPNLDRLAASGARFDRAYCNSPVCTASRASFLTGRLPHSVGVTLLKTPLADEPVTLADLLKPLGYSTAAFGKMHFNSNRTHGFDRLYDHPQINQELANAPPLPLPEGLHVKPKWQPFKDPARVWLNAEALPLGRRREDMPSTRVTNQAVEFLRTHAAKDSNDEALFFLVVSLYEPHSPFDFPIEMAGAFNPTDFDVPEIGPEIDPQIPAIFRDLTREEKQGIIAAYYTSAQFLDENMGRVLSALEESGLAEDTLVIYIGDHGYNLGHHGRFEKHCFYEPAVRAPLVIRWPGHTRANSVVSNLVEFIDIYPTIAEVCGANIPDEVEGLSLKPLLESKSASHREMIFSEYYENEEAMVFDGRFKLIYSTGKRERQDGYATGHPSIRHDLRLYDLQNDPGEFQNLAATPDHAGLLSTLKSEMLLRLKRDSFVASEITEGMTFEQQADLLLTAPDK